MRRLLLTTSFVAVLMAGALLASGVAAMRASGTDVQVRVGDRIRVVDEPLGCRVVRMAELGGRVVVDCRRGGALAGTYGTLLSAREAAVTRFRSSRTAKLLVVAKHKGGVRQCR